MKNYKYWTMILALGAAMAAPLYGCSSDDVDTPNKGGKDKTDAGTDADDDGDNGDGGAGGEGGNGDGGNGGDGGSGGSGGSPMTDETCASMGGETCAKCCADLYPGGAETYDSAIISCLCDSPGSCESVCADTVCLGQMETTQECYNCANAPARQGECQTAVNQICGADPECVNFVNNCASKC